MFAFASSISRSNEKNDERKSTENRKLELLQAQTDGIAVLSSEEETAVREELILKQEIEKLNKYFLQQ